MLRNTHPVGSITEVKASTPVLSLDGEVVPLSTTGTWGEPMFADGRVFPFSIAGLVSKYAEWPIPSITATQKFCAGKRGMVRVGGSASRTIDDRDTPDPGGGGGGNES